MLTFAIEVARQAGGFITDASCDDLCVEHKGRIDLVTRIDKGAQDIIICEILQRFPDHAILAEEGFERPGHSPYQWIIDPLDGTTNFVHDLGMYCVSIAVYKDKVPYIGVCYNPVNDMLFSAQAGKGAFLNGSPLKVSQTKRLVDSLVATGFPYTHENIEDITARLSRVIRSTQGIRRLGSAALDLCHVAAGVFEGFYEEGLHPWDMAAGVLILKEAGGRVTSMNQGAFDLYEGSILASNSLIHSELGRLM
ncbi:MAG: inositol monophosphatase family protein [Thermodesulfobacteriota bacterium]|nr:inositol monophosphatase family protein [Thermodesulfobacteriota bacterium]